MIAMLSVAGVSKRFGSRLVLNDVSLEVGPGEIVGVLGMSGSGKSTLANCILGLNRPDGGTISWHGRSLAERSDRKAARREIQPVFQDPRASLNPRWTVRRSSANRWTTGSPESAAASGRGGFAPCSTQWR